MGDPRATPAMRQFYRFKQAHPGCVLLFRMGDFYETFDDDAIAVSKAIGLTLTQRTEGVPMAGLPYHQKDVYIARLIEAGFRVAVADQIQDPKEAKGVVERAVTQVVTPGTRVDASLLPDEQVSTLAAVCFLESGDSPPAALATADLTTGDFALTTCQHDRLADELLRRGVTELLYAESPGGIGGGTRGSRSARSGGAGGLGGAVLPVNGRGVGGDRSSDEHSDLPPRLREVARALRISITPRAGWHFRPQEALEALKEHFGVSTLAGFGLRDEDSVVRPAGALLRYLRETQTPVVEPTDPSVGVVLARAVPTLAHLRPPRRDDPSTRCLIDAASLRALEVTSTVRDSALDGSLVGVFLDAGPARGRSVSAGGGGSAAATGAEAARAVRGGCATAMGKRLLREWLCSPLADVGEIRARQACVATLVEDRRLAGELRGALERVQDVARLSARVALRRVLPRELVALGRSLSSCGVVTEAIEGVPCFAERGAVIAGLREVLEPLGERIVGACVDEPPTHLREGGLIRDGIDAELDEARGLQTDASAWLAEYQSALVAKYELPNLKVGYNKVFGYFIELPAAQSKRAPVEFTRAQTLKNAERYTTPELREFESKVSTAQARAVERERVLFESLCDACGACLGEAARYADIVAELDVLCCFASKAARHAGSGRAWCRPEIVQEPVLIVEQGRHPVLDDLLEGRFVPNSLELGRCSAAVASVEGGDSGGGGGGGLGGVGRAGLALITGPNMAGKSTFIRQSALIVLLAQAGSFVPAARAVVGVADRIFTRVGADDALHKGQSTFMVEMTETARILHHATASSLVILDEIGRGTSTLDGLSLAWAITESLAGVMDEGGATTQRRRGASARSTSQGAAPRTLFATHYHELTDLEERLPGRVQNLHVTVREWGDEIVFMHRIAPGRADQSYGIHVARLAGVPKPVTERAKEILAGLAVHHGPVEYAGNSGDKTGGTRGSGGGRRDDRGSGRHPLDVASGQLPLFTEYVPHPAVGALKELKLETLSPMQAFDALRRLHELVSEDQTTASGGTSGNGNGYGDGEGDVGFDGAGEM